MIYANHFEERLDKTTSYLYIDVGGGSTELTCFSEGKHQASASFNIGTVRLPFEWKSKDLGEADLADADALIVIYPCRLETRRSLRPSSAACLHRRAA